MRLSLVFSLCAAFAPWPACADWAPTRLVTIVVPFPPGGGTDLFARALAPELAAALGKPVVIDNRSGASGNIGAESVARAAADGHTLLYTSSSIALSAVLPGGPNFDARRDLAPVTLAVTMPYVLAVHPSVPAKRVQHLVAVARAKPGTLNFSTAGNGSALHLPMELLKTMAGIDLHHVPYRGAAPAQAAVLSGEVQMAFLVPPLAQPHVKSGRLVALAVSSRERSSLFPDVPTLQEAGLDQYEALQWNGAFVPAQTPPGAIARLHQEIAKIFSGAELRRRAAAEGATIVASTPAQFAAFFQAERDKWGELVRRSAIRVD